MTDAEKESVKQMVQKAAASLAEHVDAVQIFVSKHNGGEETTMSYEHGKGNFYTRYGQISEWFAIQDQYQRNEAVRKAEDE